MTDILEVVDIKETDNVIWARKFFELIKEIKKTTNKDRLWSNYKELDKQLNHYLSFTLLVRGHDIVGFSGMHCNPYTGGEVRVLSRLYYSPEIRVKNLKGWTLPGVAVRYMLPIQLDKAKKLQKNFVFLSFQGMNRRLFCEKLAGVLRCQSGEEWSLLDGMYNTVRPLPGGGINMDASAWQNIVALKLNKNSQFTLPHMSCEDWKKKYSD